MPVDKDVRSFRRRDIRYRLYRIRSGDPVADDGLKSHFESQDDFDGWHNFAVTWDVGEEAEWPDGHFVVVRLRQSLQEKWQRTLLGLAEEPPSAKADNTCKGKTADGDSCGNKARESGYCYLHEGTQQSDPDDEPEDNNTGKDD